MKKILINYLNKNYYLYFFNGKRNHYRYHDRANHIPIGTTELEIQLSKIFNIHYLELWTILTEFEDDSYSEGKCAMYNEINKLYLKI